MIDILSGDCREQLRKLKDGSVHCVVTSPPYLGLRKYGDWQMQCVWGSKRAFAKPRHPGKARHHITLLKMRAQLRGIVWSKGMKAHICAYGLEPDIELYVEHTVEIFREVRRVLRHDGTLWLNMGDTYCQSRKASALSHGLKPKDLCGIPWRVALALQADGWFLRRDIIWAKPNPMPESVNDRPTTAHEYVFLLSKSEDYYYDSEAIKERANGNAHPRSSAASEFQGVNPKARVPTGWDTGPGDHRSLSGRYNPKAKSNGPNSRMVRERVPCGDENKPNASLWNQRPKQNESFSAAVANLVTERNKRSVWTVDDGKGLFYWLYLHDPDLLAEFIEEATNKLDVFTIATAPYKESHFATFPPKLVEPCVLAGTSARGCCAKCGAPWERVLTKERHGARDYEGKYADADNRARNLQRALKACRDAGGPHDNPFPAANTVGWQPTCECHGKLVRCKRVIPARMTSESVAAWGADTNGEYNGHSVKGHPDDIQNASDVKRRIIANATKDREVDAWVYQSALPLEKHPVVPCVVLDPFGGSGTTAMVAIENGRKAIVCEMKREYVKLIRQRTAITPGLQLAM